jgi:O-antigen/teichoic acid export membrane protein
VAIEVAKTASVAAVVLAFSWEGTAVVLTPFVIMSIGYWAVNRRHATAGSAAPGSDFDRNARVLSATAVLGVVASQVDRVLVGTFFAPTAMAAYTLGVTLTYPVRSLGGLASKLLLPRILDADAASPAFRRTFGFGLAAGAVALTAIVAAYWIVFPLIQPLLFPAYSDTGPVVRWLALATALSAFDVVAVQALWGLNDLRAFYWTQSVFPLQRMALLAMGAYFAGVPGILAAQVAHYLLCAAVILAVWLTAAPKPASA